MRASLFANATATTFGWRRALRRSSQAADFPAGFRFRHRKIECEPRMRSVRRYRFPRLLIPRRRVLLPDESWRGTSPNQAASCRPFLNMRASPMLATNALAVSGPIPGIFSSRRLKGFSRCQASISPSQSRTLSSSSRSWLKRQLNRSRSRLDRLFSAQTVNCARDWRAARELPRLPAVARARDGVGECGGRR